MNKNKIKEKKNKIFDPLIKLFLFQKYILILKPNMHIFVEVAITPTIILSSAYGHLWSSPFGIGLIFVTSSNLIGTNYVHFTHID